MSQKCIGIFFLSVLIHCASGSLCLDNSDDQCFCSRETDKETQLPLRIADCRRINLNNFPNQNDLLSDVDHLDLSFNDISDLTPTNFRSTALKKLILSYNKISNIDSKFFVNIKNLHVLDLSYNQIEILVSGDVFENLTKLKKLNLSFNFLKTLPSGIFAPFQHFRSIDLSYNPLGNFLITTPNVLNGYLQLNRDIIHIYLNNVELTTLPTDFFENFDVIKSLSLTDNNLGDVPLLPRSLEVLDMSGNNFSVITLHYFRYPELRLLKLNRLQSLNNIHKYAFYEMPKLQKLYINDCPNLEIFNDEIFGDLSKTNYQHPNYLSLARNGLKHLNRSYGYIFDHMYHVELGNNPWKCDCDILWFKEHTHVIVDEDYIRCGPSTSLESRLVVELETEDVPQCFPEKYGKRSQRILIVVLMVAVIFLMGLIFYLLKYPIVVSRKKPQVGLASPYSEEDRVLNDLHN